MSKWVTSADESYAKDKDCTVSTMISDRGMQELFCRRNDEVGTSVNNGTRILETLAENWRIVTVQNQIQEMKNLERRYQRSVGLLFYLNNNYIEMLKCKRLISKCPKFI